jgi:hypothetical protein
LFETKTNYPQWGLKSARDGLLSNRQKAGVSHNGEKKTIILRMTKQTLKYIYLTTILLITVALYLWPDFHPDKVLGSTHFWWMDMITHGGYFFAATLALLLVQLKYKPVYIGLTFFLVSILLELLQYFSYNRSVDIVDVGCNLLGISLAVGVYLLYASKVTPAKKCCSK